MTAILDRRESESLWGRFCNWITSTENPLVLELQPHHSFLSHLNTLLELASAFEASFLEFKFSSKHKCKCVMIYKYATHRNGPEP
uniref:Uncharacterized protein n=1 Tax=Helianthus annuus TaxID=4232 RepID=A0A251UYN8_HELAN